MIDGPLILFPPVLPHPSPQDLRASPSEAKKTSNPPQNEFGRHIKDRVLPPGSLSPKKFFHAWQQVLASFPICLECQTPGTAVMPQVLRWKLDQNIWSSERLWTERSARRAGKYIHHIRGLPNRSKPQAFYRHRVGKGCKVGDLDSMVVRSTTQLGLCVFNSFTLNNP